MNRVSHAVSNSIDLGWPVSFLCTLHQQSQVIWPCPSSGQLQNAGGWGSQSESRNIGKQLHDNKQLNLEEAGWEKLGPLQRYSSWDFIYRGSSSSFDKFYFCLLSLLPESSPRLDVLLVVCCYLLNSCLSVKAKPQLCLVALGELPGVNTLTGAHFKLSMRCSPYMIFSPYLCNTI